MQDKCSKTPWGAYGEICEVPGIDRQFLILVTDEESPRAIRIVVALAQLPFTVLFQVVLLETTETSAKVESFKSSSSGRSVLLDVFQKRFGMKGTVTSTALSHLSATASAQRGKDLRSKLDDLGKDQPTEHLGLEAGPGEGGPTDGKRVEEVDESVDTCVVNICTRSKIGRMMIFTVYRDLIAHNVYIRIVMHDPVSNRDCHLTLLHYTTQRLFTILRINRDMLEDMNQNEIDEGPMLERQTLRSEFGKLIVDNLYLTRQSDRDGMAEPIDHLNIGSDESVEYTLRMRDIMVPSNSAELSRSQKLMDTPPGSPSRPVTRDGVPGGFTQDRDDEPESGGLGSLIDMKEENLLHKSERVVSGRRLLVAFYNETSDADILKYSHNIRVVVACMQTLDVLYAKDLHEDTLETICARRERSHLMSAMRELDLTRELDSCLVLQVRYDGKMQGIKFAGAD
jgi:hypothetical protein